MKDRCVHIMLITLLCTHVSPYLCSSKGQFMLKQESHKGHHTKYSSTGFFLSLFHVFMRSM